MQNQTTVTITFKSPVKEVKHLYPKLICMMFHALKCICSTHSYESESVKGFKFKVSKQKTIRITEL